VFVTNHEHLCAFSHSRSSKMPHIILIKNQLFLNVAHNNRFFFRFSDREVHWKRFVTNHFLSWSFARFFANRSVKIHLISRIKVGYFRGLHIITWFFFWFSDRGILGNCYIIIHILSWTFVRVSHSWSGKMHHIILIKNQLFLNITHNNRVLFYFLI